MGKRKKIVRKEEDEGELSSIRIPAVMPTLPISSSSNASTDVVEEVSNDGVDAISGMRVEENSQKNYMGKLNRIKVYLRSNPDIGEESLDNNNNILVPLPLEVIKKIFYFLATTPELQVKGIWSLLSRRLILSTYWMILEINQQCRYLRRDIKVHLAGGIGSVKSLLLTH